jgi:hypothetical protein
MQRLCFDVTLKGFSRVDDYDDNVDLAATALISLNGDVGKVAALADDLVKWVVAPDIESLNIFLENNKLEELLDKTPYVMSDHACENYGIEDGVDFILDDRGRVVEGNIADLAKWRQQVEDFDKMIAAL